MVTVIVEDVNDNSPMFEAAFISVNIPEDISPSSEVSCHSVIFELVV